VPLTASHFYLAAIVIKLTGITRYISEQRMQEQIQWKLTDALAHAVKEENAARSAEFLASIYAHQVMLQKMVDAYWYTDKGKVERLQVDEKSLRFTSATEGMFLVRYRVSFFFACDDVTTDTAETMWCTFAVDLENDSVIVLGEEQFERSPEEF